jgi:hypothetical protein
MLLTFGLVAALVGMEPLGPKEALGALPRIATASIAGLHNAPVAILQDRRAVATAADRIHPVV